MRLLLTVMLVAGVLNSPAIASGAPEGGPRLRPQDSRIIQVLKEGMARSATFRSLVERIEASQADVRRIEARLQRLDPGGLAHRRATRQAARRRVTASRELRRLELDPGTIDRLVDLAEVVVRAAALALRDDGRGFERNRDAERLQ